MQSMTFVAVETSYRRVTLELFPKKVKPVLSFHVQSGLGCGRQVTLIVHSLAWMLKRYWHGNLLYTDFLSFRFFWISTLTSSTHCRRTFSSLLLVSISVATIVLTMRRFRFSFVSRCLRRAVRSSYRASLGFPTKPALTALKFPLFVLSDLKSFYMPPKLFPVVPGLNWPGSGNIAAVWGLPN